MHQELPVRLVDSVWLFSSATTALAERHSTRMQPGKPGSGIHESYGCQPLHSSLDPALRPRLAEGDPAPGEVGTNLRTTATGRCPCLGGNAAARGIQ
ncbi:hypothetical protein BR93DRAFT_262774 [Coniochaeta sp. PMI_546]|nr:hypothetical protein BR93DRAFT_262774 [Coniochaeta sp. PMI_546]